MICRLVRGVSVGRGAFGFKKENAGARGDRFGAQRRTHFIRIGSEAPKRTLACWVVATSVSEWKRFHSLTLVATSESDRAQPKQSSVAAVYDRRSPCRSLLAGDLRSESRVNSLLQNPAITDRRYRCGLRCARHALQAGGGRDFRPSPSVCPKNHRLRKSPPKRRSTAALGPARGRS